MKTIQRKPIRDSIAAAADIWLRTSEVRDYDGACNGLQFEGGATPKVIGATVDASLHTVRLAAKAGVDFLVVHHGIFWTPLQPLTGVNRQLVGALTDAGMSLYSSHLPLDLHPTMGNNALLAKRLRLSRCKPFGDVFGQPIGLIGERATTVRQLGKDLESGIGSQPVITGAARNRCTRVAVVTGGAGGLWPEALRAGTDVYICGELRQHEAVAARDAGLALIAAGHYATETLGPDALGRRLASRFRLRYVWIDAPTGV